MDLLDMQINVAKSACLRIGPRSDKKCCNLVTNSRYLINWTDRIRYLGTYLLSSKSLCSCNREAKACFYRSFNSIFGKIGRIAPENVIVI